MIACVNRAPASRSSTVLEQLAASDAVLTPTRGWGWRSSTSAAAPRISQCSSAAASGTPGVWPSAATTSRRHRGGPPHADSGRREAQAPLRLRADGARGKEHDGSRQHRRPARRGRCRGRCCRDLRRGRRKSATCCGTRFAERDSRSLNSGIVITGGGAARRDGRHRGTDFRAGAPAPGRRRRTRRSRQQSGVCDLGRAVCVRAACNWADAWGLYDRHYG